MKTPIVACATESMSSYFIDWFPDLFVLGNKDRLPEKLDLLILTGGSDIHPKAYGERPSGAIGWSLERDENELGILYEVLERGLPTAVLGVCRGLQLLNVFFGGTLFQDINSIGSGHPGSHEIVHLVEDTKFSWLKTVNSMHHQGVRDLGICRGKPPLVIATEPKTQLPEIVLWGSRYCGVQFHPEFFGEDKSKKFFSTIISWALGKEKIAPPEKDEGLFRKNPLPYFSIVLEERLNTRGTE